MYKTVLWFFFISICACKEVTDLVTGVFKFHKEKAGEMFSERKKTFMDECQEHIWVISQNNSYLFIYLFSLLCIPFRWVSKKYI